MDSIARSTLLVIQGRQTVTAPDGRALAPSEWLLETMLNPAVSDKLQVLEIVHPGVLEIFNLSPEDGSGKKRFSLDQLKPRLEEFSRQVRLAAETDGGARNVFQKKVLDLNNSLMLFQKVRFSIQDSDTVDFPAELKRFAELVPAANASVKAKEAGKPVDDKALAEIRGFIDRYQFIADNALFLAVPPEQGEAPEGWRNMGAALQKTFSNEKIDPWVTDYARLAKAWREHDSATFNATVASMQAKFNSGMPDAVRKSRVETLFNTSQPFYTSTNLYVIAFLCGVLSWMFWAEPLRKAGYWVLIIAALLTTAGIVARMWLEGRPPVTNLYSSALFVGWVAVVICVVLEGMFRNAVASVAAGFIGTCTLIIAHHLSLSSGDTMEMMRAVLDSNFWLATHVITISIGYGATFLAGLLGLIYVFRGTLTKSLDPATADSLARMVYGIVCFATLFSLVGTILGGIWADQSWGRFWGWDPKENGALIIVLWNAVILHARWGGLIRQRGLMGLAIFGNIVTAWSWFGTNMLGVGLHSYGFMDSAFVALMIFVGSQLAAIGLAALPPDKWRSTLKS